MSKAVRSYTVVSSDLVLSTREGDKEADTYGIGEVSFTVIADSPKNAVDKVVRFLSGEDTEVQAHHFTAK